MATVGFGKEQEFGTQMNSYEVLLTNQCETDTALMQEAVQTIMYDAISKIESFTPQQMSNMAWSVPRLVDPPVLSTEK